VSQAPIYEFFHYTPDDVNFYHVTCKIFLKGSFSLDNNDYEHGFFYECPNNSVSNYYVTCKLLPHSLIVNILNRKVYGMDLDIGDLKQKEQLCLNQKFN